MRILICDDDTLIIEQLQKYIESYFESNHLKCPELVSFTSGESLLAEKRTYKKTTVFFVILFGLLDIALFLLGKYIYTICFSVGILLTAGLQAPCIVKKMCKSTKNRL